MRLFVRLEMKTTVECLIYYNHFDRIGYVVTPIWHPGPDNLHTRKKMSLETLAWCLIDLSMDRRRQDIFFLSLFSKNITYFFLSQTDDRAAREKSV